MTGLEQASELVLSRWILPVSTEAIENACLVLDGTRIHSIISQAELEALPEKSKAKLTVTNHGDAVICPALINLHTHLDYSALKHFDNYSPFFTWIRGLIGNSWQWSPEQWLESALMGAEEIMLSGTSTIADASYSGAAAKAVARSGLRGVVGLELFGIDEENADSSFDEWLQKYRHFMDEAAADPELKDAIQSKRLQITIAPHTPYSVCPALLSRAVAWSREKKLPLLIHISESLAECKWIAADEPDLDQFLREAFKKTELGELGWRGHGLSPVEHLEKHGLLNENVLAAHLAQVNETDIEILKRHKVSAVSCPRSNSRLGNGAPPISKLMKAGINLGFGTDSSASTDDLNLLNEVRFAWDLARALDRDFKAEAQTALKHLTIDGARALKLDGLTGSLETGKQADYSVFSLAALPQLAKQKPFDCLIYGGARLTELVVDGKKLVANGNRV